MWFGRAPQSLLSQETGQLQRQWLDAVLSCAHYFTQFVSFLMELPPIRQKNSKIDDVADVVTVEVTGTAATPACQCNTEVNDINNTIAVKIACGTRWGWRWRRRRWGRRTSACAALHPVSKVILASLTPPVDGHCVSAPVDHLGLVICASMTLPHFEAIKRHAAGISRIHVAGTNQQPLLVRKPVPRATDALLLTAFLNAL